MPDDPAPRVSICSTYAFSGKTLDELHGEERLCDHPAAGIGGCDHARLEDLRNARMMQSAEDAHFLIESPLKLGE